MRWILVFLFLYLIPVVIVFKNYRNFKRSCLYSSIYVVLVTTIVITNVYVSGLNKIKEFMYYQNYVSEEQYSEIHASNFEDDVQSKNKPSDGKKEVITKKEDKDNTKEEKEIASSNQNLKPIDVSSNKKTDEELIYSFKKEVYEIETIALVPMRDCMTYTKNVAENLKNLKNIREDLTYAKEKCEEVIKVYSNMDIPSLSNDEHSKELENARDDVMKAYELRKLAMESSIKLVDSKNPKYIGKITEYLNLSDNQISNFKNRMNDLNNKINTK